MSLGKLVVSLVAESAEFIKGLDKAGQAADRNAKKIDVSMASIVKGVLASEAAMWAAQTALGTFTRAFEAAGQAIDSAQSLGTTPEKFFNMKVAIDAAGDSFEGIPGLINKLNASLGEMGSETDGKAKLVKALGLSLDELKSSDPVDALKSVAVALQDISDPVIRVRVGQELLGKAYKDSAPALAAWVESGDATTRVSEEMLAAMDSLSDTIAALNSEASVTATILGGSVAPTLQEVITQVLSMHEKSEGLTSFMSDTLNVVVVGTGLLLVALKEAVLQAGNAIGSLVGALVHLGSGNLDAAWETLKAGTRQSDEIARASIEAGKAILNARKNAEVAARQSKGDFSDIADATARAAAQRDFFRKGEIATQNAMAKSSAEAKKFNGVLSNLGDKKAGPDKIAQEFQRIQDEINKATMSAREYQLARFKGLNASGAQVAKYTLQLDALDAAKVAQEFKKQLEDLEHQASLVGQTVDQQAVSEYAKRLDDAGIKGQQAALLMEKFQATLGARHAEEFGKELAALSLEIEKVGKSAQTQAEIDIKAKFTNPDEQAQMLAANTRKFAALNAEGVKEVFAKLRQESANIGATPLTQYLNELREAQKLNPAITDSVIKLAAAQKQAALDAAEAWAENTRQAQEASQVLVGGLEDVIWGAEDGADAADAMVEALGRMVVQTLILKPLLKELQAGLEGIGSGAGNGGGWVGAVADFVGGFFGGGRAGGGDVQPNSIYEVAEAGPELAKFNGRTYLMTGNSRGTVEPASNGAPVGGGGNSYAFNYTIDARGADAGSEARIQAAIKRSQEETLAKVQALNDRGGAFARSSGRA